MYTFVGKNHHKSGKEQNRMDTPKYIEAPDAYKTKYDIARAQLKATEDLYIHQVATYEQALREAKQTQDSLQEEVVRLKQQLSFVRQAEAVQKPTHTLSLEQMEQYAIGSRNKTQAEAIVAMLNETLPMDSLRTEAVARIRSHYDKPATTIGVLNNHGCQQFYGNVADSDFHS